MQPAPRLGAFVWELTAILEAEAALPRRERRSTHRLFELRWRGYEGAHDSVHRFAGTGAGKTRLAIAVASAVVRSHARGRFYSLVDLVNQLEQEAAGRGGVA